MPARARFRSGKQERERGASRLINFGFRKCNVSSDVERELRPRIVSARGSRKANAKSSF